MIPKFNLTNYPIGQIDKGLDGVVVRISEDLVAKIPFTENENEAKTFAIDECEIADALYEHGVSVPKPEGVYILDERIRNVLNLKSNGLENIAPALYGFVMQYIPGVKLNDESILPYDNLFEELNAKSNLNLEKSMEVAIPEDHGPYNVLVDESESEVFLIDFAGWRLID